VVEVLGTAYVPVAIDCIYYEFSTDEHGAFFRKLALEALLNPVNDDGGRSLQGHYVASASGRLLAAQNVRGKAALLDLLERGRVAFAALDAREAAPPLDERAPRDRRWARRLPEGGLALNVYARIAGFDEAKQTSREPYQLDCMRTNRERTGFDHLWIRADELEGLLPPGLEAGARWRAPARLARRLARFHLVDTVRGEPPHYEAGHVKRATIACTAERVEAAFVTVRLEGEFELDASKDPQYPRGFKGTLAGRLIYDRTVSRFACFDLYVEGDAHGDGKYIPGAPQGGFRLAIGFEIPPSPFATEIPPQAMREPDRYWNP